MGAVISRVDPQSVAARFGFVKGDEIITINGQLLRDIIDYWFLSSEHKLSINYVRDGFPRTTVIHKPVEEPLGLDFEDEVFDGIMPCRYNCQFCFVKQMPKGMRKSLYVHDDDYRLSFRHGSYITLTGLAENDLRRITAMRLSPLYVSVHSTDPDVRADLMGSPSAGNILKMLNKLKTHNITVHAQIVVVPGVNDGKALKKTLADLYDLFPTVKSTAIVPVGLTSHRQGLPRLKPFKKSNAQHVHQLVQSFQQKALKRYKRPLFYLSDEIYLLMEEDFPRHSHYGYFDQLENGVGLSRKLITDFNRRKRFIPKTLDSKREVILITGVLGEKVLKPLLENFQNVKKLKIRVLAVKNRFFGTNITVTGLLTGQDILAQLKTRLKSKKPTLEIIIPDLLLRDGKFLDDMTPEDIEKELGIPVAIVSTDAAGLFEGILGTGKKGKPSDKDNSTTDSPEDATVLEIGVDENGDDEDDSSDDWWDDEEPAGEEDRKLIKVKKPPARRYHRSRGRRKNTGRRPAGRSRYSRSKPKPKSGQKTNK